MKWSINVFKLKECIGLASAIVRTLGSVKSSLAISHVIVEFGCEVSEAAVASIIRDWYGECCFRTLWLYIELHMDWWQGPIVIIEALPQGGPRGEQLVIVT
jgi:hypothetical protein